MELSLADKVLLIGFSIGLAVGIVYSKVKYGLPFFHF